MPRFLMCSPDHFGVEYEINVHMSLDNMVYHREAMTQWADLAGLLVRLGAQVDLLPPQEGCPDLVFTANAGLVQGGRIALSNFAVPERRPEESHYAAHFDDYTSMKLPARVYYEGAGDSFIHANTLYLGTGFRSQPEALPELLNFLDVSRAVICRSIDPRFYHLDTAFCPLTPEEVMYFPGAFDLSTQAALAEEPWDGILVPREEAARFACNAVVVGKHVVLPLGCPRTGEMLMVRGFEVHETNMSEFLKAGGACKCLTLAL